MCELAHCHHLLREKNKAINVAGYTCFFGRKESELTTEKVVVNERGFSVWKKKSNLTLQKIDSKSTSFFSIVRHVALRCLRNFKHNHIRPQRNWGGCAKGKKINFVRLSSTAKDPCDEDGKVNE